MKTFALLVTLISFSSLGEILSAHGMKQVGEVSFSPRELLRSVRKMMGNISLLGGVACMAVSFFSFLSLLSFADLSFVVPLTAVSYITNTIGSRFLLGERISKARWWGTILVSTGVAFISIPSSLGVEAGLYHVLEFLSTHLNPENSEITPVVASLLGLRLILLLLVAASIGYAVTVIVAGALWWKDRSKQRELGLDFTPPISILVPVCGADEDAFANFSSLCQQEYPEYEVVFGCRDKDDSAIPVIRRIQEAFPALPVRLVINSHQTGTNAKISNLINILAEVRNEYLFIVDSDIRVTPDYLRRVVAPLRVEGTGMVTCLYRGSGAKTLATLIENVGISSTFGPEVMSSRALEGVKFALGSTIAIRRSLFDAIGGFQAVADQLADDYVLGNRTAALGYEVVLSDYVVDHVSGRDTLAGMLRHQIRWGRSTRIVRPKGYTGLILTYGMATSLMLWASLGFSEFGRSLVILSVAVRMISAIWGGVILMGDPRLLPLVWMVPFRDLLAFGIWLASLFGKEVSWRGKTYIVQRDGTMKPVA